MMDEIEKARVLHLADTIEKAPHSFVFYGEWEDYSGERPQGFNMARWNCGSAACIGGWAEAIFFEGATDENKIADLLGIHDRDEQNRLFYPELSSAFMIDITPQWAAATLRNLAGTGRVDWEGSKP